MKNELIHDMTKGSIPKLMLSFAWPLMLSNLLQTLYNIIDMIVVGQVVGSIGLAAVSNGGSVVNLAMMTCMGFTSAGQVLISQSVGAGEFSCIQKIIGTLTCFISGLAAATTVLGLVFARQILWLINTPEESFPAALLYCRICFVGCIFMFGYNMVSAILRGMGDSRHPLMFISLAAVSNLILDLLLVKAAGLGAGGAALATVAGQGISFLFSFLYLYKKREQLGFEFCLKSFRADREILQMLLSLAIPMALEYMALNISKLFIAFFINSFGVTASAVDGVGQKISNCVLVIGNALNAAGTTMIGQNLGAGKHDRIKKCVYFSLAVNLVFASVLSLIMLYNPELVFSIFNRDADILEMSHVYAPIAVCNFFGFALRCPIYALIDGTGAARLSLATGLVSGIFARILLSLFLGYTCGMGIIGFWLGDVCAGAVPFLVGAVYFASGAWKKKKLVGGQKG